MAKIDRASKDVPRYSPPQTELAVADSLSPRSAVSRIRELIKLHDEWYTNDCIPLNAAEAAISPLAREAQSSSLANRAIAGSIGRRSHTGLEQVDEIDSILVSLAKRLFGCQYVEYRMQSCAMANGYALRLLTEPDDAVLALDIGHPTYREEGYGGFRALRFHDLPVRGSDLNVDLDVYEKLMARTKPTLVALGQSEFLFPYPLKQMAGIAESYSAKIMYDAAHVMGLIAGKQFQQPMQEGADVVTSSTGKSLSASLGGLLLHNNSKLNEKIDKTWFGHVSGNNSARLASLAIVFAEHLEYGEAFYTQVVRNAKALAGYLDEVGFSIPGRERGYTESHQVLVNCIQLGDNRKLAASMRETNILFTPFSLPQYGMSGFRLATTTCTAYGMREPEMQRIASFFKRTILDNVEPTKVRKDVIELRRCFTQRHFCFQ